MVLEEFGELLTLVRWYVLPWFYLLITRDEHSAKMKKKVDEY
jgi:hypothetical protein